MTTTDYYALMDYAESLGIHPTGRTLQELHRAIALALERRVPACASEDEREEMLRRIDYHWDNA